MDYKIMEDAGWKRIKLTASNNCYVDYECFLETHPKRDDFIITLIKHYPKQDREFSFAVKKEELKKAIENL